MSIAPLATYSHEGSSVMARRVSLAVFLFILALCVFQALHYYPLLPDKVASHFGPSGKPDAWSTKSVFVTLYLAVIGGCALFFLGLGFIIRVIPRSLLNLPNKAYWLAEERREQTYDFMLSYTLWFSSATLAVIARFFPPGFSGCPRQGDHAAAPRIQPWPLYRFYGAMAHWPDLEI